MNEHLHDHKPQENKPHPHFNHKEHNHAEHHMMMIKNFKKKFYVSITFTVPVLILSPMVQNFLGYSLDFKGNSYILFVLSTFIFFYGGWPFLKGLFEEAKKDI